MYSALNRQPPRKPPPAGLSVFVQSGFELLRRQVSVLFPVDGDNRGDAAGPEAPRRRDGELEVRGRLPGLDPKLALEGLHDGLDALDVAGRAQADADVVPPLGDKGELGIEGRHAVDLRHRNPELLRHDLQHLLGEVPEAGLRILQDGHQHTLAQPVVVYEATERLNLLAVCLHIERENSHSRKPPPYRPAEPGTHSSPTPGYGTIYSRLTS